MIFQALFRALPQVGLPTVRSVLWRTLGLTLLVFLALGILVWLGLRALVMQIGWLQDAGVASAVLAVLIGILCAWLLFRAIAIAIVGLYAERLVAAVEMASYGARHELARAVPPIEGLRVAIRSGLRAIGWNLAVLPLYALLLVTGVGAPLLFLLVNAYLFGRDLAELVEGGHPDLPRFTSGQRWQLGLVSALLFVLPVINLLAPVWSVAMATHMFHGRQKG